MRISEEGIALIKKYEGLRLEPYDDGVGFMTIGYGHKILPGEAFTSITEEYADALLRRDLERAERCVNNSVSGNLTQGQFDACCSFVFNLGCGAFGKSTLLKHLNEGNDLAAAAEFTRWNKAGGKVLAGLTKRRQAEMEMFLA